MTFITLILIIGLGSLWLLTRKKERQSEVYLAHRNMIICKLVDIHVQGNTMFRVIPCHTQIGVKEVTDWKEVEYLCNDFFNNHVLRQTPKCLLKIEEKAGESVYEEFIIVNTVV